MLVSFPSSISKPQIPSRTLVGFNNVESLPLAVIQPHWGETTKRYDDLGRTMAVQNHGMPVLDESLPNKLFVLSSRWLLGWRLACQQNEAI